MGIRTGGETFGSFRKGVDFGRAAAEYRKFRAGFPQRFFEQLAAQLALKPGSRALDLGTGTGTVARGLAELGLGVTAIDPSVALMYQAADLDREAGVTVEYLEGRAEDLPFDNDTFDIVTAGQCWHWFDRPLAAEEALRVLKPGGWLVIAHFDWIPLSGNVVHATETLILEVNPKWLPMAGGTGIHPQWLGDMAMAGFGLLQTMSFDVDQPYSHEAWIGRIKASAGIKASLDAQETDRFAERLAEMLHNEFSEDPLAVPHRVWWVCGQKPAT